MYQDIQVKGGKILKVLSLFSGIGAFEKALDRLNIDYELVAFSEIDKYATKSYCAIHGVDESMNLGDITKVDENSLPKNIDLITYGFPCQDISLAGKQKGLVNYCEIDKYASKSYSAIHNVPESMNLGDITKVDTTTLPNDIDLVTYGFPCQDISLAGKQKGLFNNDGTQTRSGLFFEALRIIEATKPKIAIAENVKNLTGARSSKNSLLSFWSLDEAGYNNYWKVLNAKDYGIPQNRERVFIISIRKDIDKGFEFPEPFPLKLRLKDMLEDKVDEKYYLSDEQILTAGYFGNAVNPNLKDVYDRKKAIINKQVSYTISTKPDRRIGDCNYVTDDRNEMTTEEFLKKKFGEGQKILVREATKKGYAEAEAGDSINIGQPNSKTRRGRVGKQVSQTLTTSGGNEMTVVVDE